ncbi:MAG: hypothetical protein AAGD00_04495 [Planctomycetota bacterium]
MATNRILAAFAIAASSVLAMSPAQALADKVTLNDGRVLEGEITREVRGMVWIEVTQGTITTEMTIAPDQIKSIEYIEGDKVEEEIEPETELVIPPGATKVAFITLEEMVGPYLNADALMRSAEYLDELPTEIRPDVLVLRVNSGGGALLEVEPLMDTIQDEIKPMFRTVGWIESAISAASLTIFNCEEIYMTKEGNVGGTVAYSMQSGGAKAMDGEGLEFVLEMGEQISANGGYDPLIMRAMQIFTTLTATPDGNGGWIFFEGDEGEVMVSPEDRILTFNAIDSERFNVSLGTADTKDELAKLMGLTEWVEVGQKADEMMVEFRESVKEGQARGGELWSKMNIYIEAGQINKAKRFLRELKSIARRAPSLAKYGAGPLPPLTDDFFRNVEQQLDDMARQQRRGRGG